MFRGEVIPDKRFGENRISFGDELRVVEHFRRQLQQFQVAPEIPEQLGDTAAVVGAGLLVCKGTIYL
jgi:hypothetical protein